uniref:Globin, monomeric component M-IV n=1 Tax=Zeugodacus cucurbitae TaxID=28588 RepID=A0A0A1X397_ZEUCU
MGSYIEATVKKTPPVFPRALEPYDIRPVANELGLTSTERKSLQNGWTIIKQKQRRAALNIYVNFFTGHEDLYEIFRFNGTLDIGFASQHQKDVLTVFQMIFEQLDNARFVKTMMKELALRHQASAVTNTMWQLYANEVKHYFLKTLNDALSPTFVHALETLINYICDFNELTESRDEQSLTGPA